MLRRVGDVKHLVEEDILDDVLRHLRIIERTADRYGVVGSVVMAEDSVGVSRRPCQYRFREFSTEVPEVKRIEYLVEIVNRSL